MKLFVRGVAALLFTAALVAGAPVAPAHAQAGAAPQSERDRVSYMVGHDIARSLAPAAPDIDLPAFEEAVRNALEGGAPLIAEQEVEQVARAVMARVDSRRGRAPADATIPDVDRKKAGWLFGADVGRSLAPIQGELELPVLFAGMRATFEGRGLQMDEAALESTRRAFSERLQADAMARAQEMATRNREEGEAFLATNRQQKGVFTTGSGLQYMVLRQGAGERPRADSTVRVNYEGRLLDGTVFDSSYERGQPAEFGLQQVIPGWTEGLQLMPVGGKYRFWIPGELGYGSAGTPGGPIGPDATLVFDVELQAIVN